MRLAFIEVKTIPQSYWHVRREGNNIEIGQIHGDGIGRYFVCRGAALTPQELREIADWMDAQPKERERTLQDDLREDPHLAGEP